MRNRILEMLLTYCLLTYCFRTNTIIGAFIVILFGLLLDFLEVRKQTKELDKLKASIDKDLNDLLNKLKEDKKNGSND